MNVSMFGRNVLTPFLAWLGLIQVHSADAVKIIPYFSFPPSYPRWSYFLQPCHVSGTFLSSSIDLEIQMVMERKFLRYRRRCHLCAYVRLHRPVLYLLIKCLFYYPKNTTIWIFHYTFYHILASFIILQLYILVQNSGLYQKSCNITYTPISCWLLLHFRNNNLYNYFITNLHLLSARKGFSSTLYFLFIHVLSADSWSGQPKHVVVLRASNHICKI